MIAFCLRHFFDTIAIARIDNQLRAELARRAEYAMRYQIHSPGQWSWRPSNAFIAIALALLTMLVFCLR